MQENRVSPVVQVATAAPHESGVAMSCPFARMTILIPRLFVLSYF
jgi:hypothetical protein